MRLEHALQAIRDAGFTPRGGFTPRPDDNVPDLTADRPARVVLLVGNVGPTMWERFARKRNTQADLLDAWTSEELSAVARRLGAKALFPFSRPHLPFQRWACRAEACHISPLGIAIHCDYGLWHAYRGALVFAEPMELPPADVRPSPCDTCVARPCLSACPVNAFTGSDYDFVACARHLASPAGSECMSLGCLARHACPEGRDYAYEPDQAAFLMKAYLRGRQEDKTI